MIIFIFSANIDPGRRYLYLHIKSGKAFLEHIDENDGTPGQVASYFSFHIHFRGQRFKSRPIACACEPDIDEGFLLELHKDGAGMYCNTMETKTLTGNKLGGDGRNGRPRGRNFSLNVPQGEVGVSLKKIKLGDSFSICHHMNTICGDNLLPMYHI